MEGPVSIWRCVMTAGSLALLLVVLILTYFSITLGSTPHSIDSNWPAPSCRCLVLPPHSFASSRERSFLLSIHPLMRIRWSNRDSSLSSLLLPFFPLLTRRLLVGFNGGKRGRKQLAFSLFFPTRTPSSVIIIIIINIDIIGSSWLTLFPISTGLP